LPKSMVAPFFAVAFYSQKSRKYTLQRKQDHLVCFLGGSLMLGATTVGQRGAHSSRPPQEHEFTSIGKRDWETGYQLIETCVDTHNTAT